MEDFDRKTKGCASLLLLLAVHFAFGCNGSGGGSSSRPPGGGALEIVRGPQLALVTDTAITIAWLSSQAASGAVEYGLDLTYGTAMSSGAGLTEHVVRLEGLSPETRYFYRVLLDGSVMSEGHTFLTGPPVGDTPFRFVVFGDSGSGGSNQAAIAQRTLAVSPEIVLIVGDVVYDAGRSSELDPHYFTPFAGLLDRITFYPCLGNHDVQTQNGAPLLSSLYLPSNTADGTEHFFSFDHGNAHFVALDSNASLAAGGAQWNWLDSDLGAASARWKFVYFHHPPYSSSQHGSSVGIRHSLTPLLDAHHVDIVFNGHDHDYERSFPMLNEQVTASNQDPSYTDPPGTIFIVTGGGGRSLYGKGTSFFTAFSASKYHLTQVDIDGSSLVLKAVLADGTVLDELHVTKS